MDIGLIKVIILFVILLGVVIVGAIEFCKLPKEKQKKKIKEWLKWAVAAVEKELGPKTGSLKLRKVYSMFCITFPRISKLITFEIFSYWVDDALSWMDKELSDNKAIDTYVNGEKIKSCTGATERS